MKLVFGVLSFILGIKNFKISKIVFEILKKIKFFFIFFCFSSYLSSKIVLQFSYFTMTDENAGALFFR